MPRRRTPPPADGIGRTGRDGQDRDRAGRRKRRMFDVRPTIDAVRLRAEEDAYWHALDKALGIMTSRLLRSTLRNVGQGLTERDRVANGLSDVYAIQAKAVEELARQETRVAGPEPRGEALTDLPVHEHWIDFSDEGSEPARSIPFVERGFERGAQVVALVPSQEVEAYEREAERSGHAEDVRRGRFSFVSIDSHLGALRTAGVLTALALAIEGLIQGARAQNYAEIWFISRIASALLTSTPPFADLALRMEDMWGTLLRSYPIAVYCPFPIMIPAAAGFASSLLQGHSWTSLVDVALRVGTRVP